MDRWREQPVLRVTLVLVSAAFLLIGAGAAGLGGSLPLALAFATFAAGLYLAALVATETPLANLDRSRFHADLWLAPVIAAVVTLLWTDATAGELQSLGGLVGLVGMANYFLRPVYRFAYGLGTRVANAVA